MTSAIIFVYSARGRDTLGKEMNAVVRNSHTYGVNGLMKEFHLESDPPERQKDVINAAMRLKISDHE